MRNFKLQHLPDSTVKRLLRSCTGVRGGVGGRLLKVGFGGWECEVSDWICFEEGGGRIVKNKDGVKWVLCL